MPPAPHSLALLALLALPIASAHAQPAADGIDIITAIAAATARFEGRVIAADLLEGRDDEPRSVYSLRLLTPAGDVIEVRIDAEAGRIIEVNGRGLVEARRTP